FREVSNSARTTPLFAASLPLFAASASRFARTSPRFVRTSSQFARSTPQFARSMRHFGAFTSLFATTSSQKVASFSRFARRFVPGLAPRTPLWSLDRRHGFVAAQDLLFGRELVRLAAEDEAVGVLAERLSGGLGLR